jgi:hypothetical protein
MIVNRNADRTIARWKRRHCGFAKPLSGLGLTQSLSFGRRAVIATNRNHYKRSDGTAPTKGKTP